MLPFDLLQIVEIFIDPLANGIARRIAVGLLRRGREHVVVLVLEGVDIRRADGPEIHRLFAAAKLLLREDERKLRVGRMNNSDELVRRAALILMEDRERLPMFVLRKATRSRSLLQIGATNAGVEAIHFYIIVKFRFVIPAKAGIQNFQSVRV